MTEGRRERKRRETRDRIADGAMKLFLAHGYDATTMDDIADAADVSRRSLFDYFATKEDVLFARQDDFVVALALELRKRPSDEAWPVLVEHALAQAVADAISPENVAIDALVNRTPALLPRRQLKYMRLEDAIAGALAERSKRARKDAALLAAVVVAGFRIMASTQTIVAREDVEAAVAAGFRDFWKSLRGFAELGLAPRRRGAA